MSDKTQLSVSAQYQFKEFEGPFSKVAVEFRHHSDSKRDAMTIVLYDEDGEVKERITVAARASGLDGAILMTAHTGAGKAF